LSACAPALVSSWTSPDATRFPLEGEKVAAVVIATDVALRLAAEEALARELSMHGARGIPMYTLAPGADLNDEAKARAAAEAAGVVGAVVMRPVRIEKEISQSAYSGSMYGSFWGGYYGHGWASPWGPGMASGGNIRTDTIVYIETLVFGLRENKLLWAGQSKTTNPRNLDRLVKDTAAQVAQELERLGLVTES
jgi:uncharacterized membrane protein